MIFRNKANRRLADTVMGIGIIAAIIWGFIAIFPQVGEFLTSPMGETALGQLILSAFGK